jgi:hypothetical protein
LAVVELTRSAAVLPGDPGRFGALFDKARFVDGQHSVLLTQTGQHVLAVRIAQGLGVPLRAPEEVLEAIGVGQPGGFGQLPTVFALDLA